MYHPSRGGVRGGRDQFSWDDVKVDKHRENYLGHSIKAPVGRWQKGKDLHWYNREKHSSSDMEAIKEEIKRVKEQEEQAMREALGLAPKRASQPQGSRLDKHEFSELVKRGSTAEDVGEGHAEAARVQGLGFSRGVGEWERSGSIQQGLNDVSCERVKTAMPMPSPPVRNSNEGGSEDEISKRKRRRDDRKHKKLEKRHARDSDDKRSRRKERIRPDSD